MYYVMRASAPSLHRESTDSLILCIDQPILRIDRPILRIDRSILCIDRSILCTDNFETNGAPL